MTPHARQRLAELEAVAKLQLSRRDFTNTAKTLLEIDRSARVAGIKTDTTLKSVDPDFRANLWLRMVRYLRMNNQPNEATAISKLWGKDRGAA
ncbi:hypothetical protein [Nitrobacter sp. JJSN]|uniref:hypothetical protein n=1 Tax=Nitrobacter sp. JJSN TaxID=3453033 RepID=UPI003F76F9EF